MATAINRRNKKRCKAMSARELRTLIGVLEPEVREAASLLECAKREYRRRSHREKDELDEGEEA